MREMLVCSRELCGEDGRIRRYRYSVLIDEMDVGNFACESYGVRVQEEPRGECAQVLHITTSIPRIDALMERVCGGVVPPCALRDVIEDWL